MATYQIQPNLQAFDVPTFEQPAEFLFQVARQKQLQFNTGLEATRAEYNSMESLPVSSQYATAKRDAYVQDASQKLRKIAGADFSMEENRFAAHSIYKPMTSDRDILTDLQKSRQGQKQLNRMDALQNSKDEKERALYWDTGREYVNRSIKQLQNAKTSEELKNVEIRDFVPYSDIIGKLNKAATDLKLKVSIDSVSGGYILTKENGEKANLPFYLWAQSQLDSQERETLKVIGTVEGDRRIDQEIYTKGVPESVARQNLATEAIQRRFNDFTSQINDNAEHIGTLKKIKKELEDAGVTDQSRDKWLDATTKIEMIEKQNELIENRLRDIGYTKMSGSYVPNERYQNTVKVFARDLSLPYAEDAARNITTNWAAGLAAATTTLSIKSDPNYIKALDLQLEAIKASGKLSEAEANAGKGTTKAKKEEPENLINQPLQVGYNPYGKEQISSYEFFKSQKKAFQDDLMTKGVDFIQDALPDMKLDPDFLTELSTNMKKGAGDAPIAGGKFDLATKYPEQIKQINQAIQDGKVPGASQNPTYSDLFRGLVAAANTSTSEQLKAGKALPDVSHLIRQSKEVEQNLKAYQVFKDDEKKIQEGIIAKNPEYAPYYDKENGKFLSLDEYADKVGGGTVQAQTISGQSKPITVADVIKKGKVKRERDEKGITSKYIDVDGYRYYDATIDPEGIRENYNKADKNFRKDFTGFINSGQAQFLNRAPGTSGEYGYVYPVFEFQSRKNPTDTNEREVAEIALARAFNPENLADETKITNLKDLGSAGTVQKLARSFQNEVSDFTPDMGKIYYVQVSRDGKNPGILFKPSIEFLKKYSKDPLDNSTIANISKYGIEIATDVPEIAKQRPSLVGRLLDINKEYNILPELKDEGFTGRVVKKTNGRGYGIHLSYKTYDALGNEIIKNDELQNPDQPIPESRLDVLSESLINDILTAYYNYKGKKEAINKTTNPAPKKVYTKEELELLYKSQQ